MNFYNDNDPKACAWLRELIRCGHLPAGDVDCRSITDIQPQDLRRYTACHFFAGIGGWPLALQWAGWPGDAEVWTGSCPCQPLSSAGQRKGHADERHLWPAFYALIAECRPATVFGEQVASADGREWLAGVRADLEGTGYAVGAADLCAAGVGAPHRRQRLFWVADAGSWRQSRPKLERDDCKNEKRTGRGMQSCIASITGASSNSASVNRSCCATGGLADADCEGRDLRHRGCRARGIHAGGFTNAGGGAGAVDDPTSSRRNRQEQDPEENPRNEARMRVPGPAIRVDWSRFTTVHCRDGKTRRFESGSFPLAYGIPGRVGLLRGYGNAIVPQVAAEFVRAFMECQ